MDRQDRDRYDRTYDNDDFGRYEGYRNDDERYHSARNLTNEFERDYQRERGGRWIGDDEERFSSSNISYHEGNDLGDMYERRMQDQGHFRWYSDLEEEENKNLVRRFSGGLNRSHDEDRNYSRNRYQDEYRNRENRSDWDRDRYDSGRTNQGSLRQGYGVSDYGGTSDRFNTLGNDQYSSRNGQSYGSNYSRDSRYGSGMGDAPMHSDRGIPNYSTSSFADDYGTGMGSSYGARNYGTGQQRGDSFSNQNYGASSGNYGGYGSAASGTNSSRSTSGHSSDPYYSDRGEKEFRDL
ncbi:hypothetical protein H7F15_06240 [Pontibacter sp. Tf4]|uniref:hypothetical protein n=1 Tax=Pontibacter sp. Tf4 TaxID=2761620 RepID=UPI00162A69C2|nr:hypothetical protein [Pontibacter sp. Tf4]MBB6610628.1 hypothetical protein [Pontibacter sp. Tf4]